MESFEALPAVPLEARGPCSKESLQRGLEDLRSLGHLLRDLPYGRTADRADWRGVLASGRGTCSTKHAFLAATAAEISAPVRLTLGLYEMTEANTPGVGETLVEAGLGCVPEAHCYARVDDTRIDVTRANVEPMEAIDFLAEETIEPDQIGQYKVDWHRRHLRAWCETHGEPEWLRVWEIRERCIAAIAATS
jgi:hypothetical protein